MKEESSHIIYNAKDIHKYLMGELTPTEMHAMEKAALNDPLLADAIDGFTVSASFKNKEGFSTLQQDLDILRKKIITHSTVKDTTWWKVAAAAIILVGSCLTFYTITNHTDQQKEAGVLQQPIVKAPEPKESFVATKPITPPIVINTKTEPVKSPDMTAADNGTEGNKKMSKKEMPPSV